MSQAVKIAKLKTFSFNLTAIKDLKAKIVLTADTVVKHFLYDM